jgi:hypothetical protein
VRVIRTDEEGMIGKTVFCFLVFIIKKKRNHENKKGFRKEQCYEGKKWG